MCIRDSEYFDQLETIEYRLHNGQRDETVYINASSFVDWAYFSFETNSEVNIVDPETSLDWDLAFKRNHIKTNSGLSGQGLGGAYVDTSSTWLENWANLNTLPVDASWSYDTEWCLSLIHI